MHVCKLKAFVKDVCTANYKLKGFEMMCNVCVRISYEPYHKGLILGVM